MDSEEPKSKLEYRTHEWVLTKIDRQRDEARVSEVTKQLLLELKDSITKVQLDIAIQNLIDDPTGATSNLDPKKLALIRNRLYGDRNE